MPLNTIVLPRSVSCIGWWPAGDGSMIASRLFPSATAPPSIVSTETPASSGPRAII